jgi:hypothetical protein
MDRASWLRLMMIISFLANIRLKTSHFIVPVITSLRDPRSIPELSQPGAWHWTRKYISKNFSQQPAEKAALRVAF